MKVLVTYDVSTSDPGGAKRLHKIAVVCVRYGQRVQNSVFECSIDPSQYEMLKHELLSILDDARDSLRLYNLGKNYQARVEHFGIKQPYDPDGLLLI